MRMQIYMCIYIHVAHTQMQVRSYVTTYEFADLITHLFIQSCNYYFWIHKHTCGLGAPNGIAAFPQTLYELKDVPSTIHTGWTEA